MSTNVILGSAAEANPGQGPQELPLMHADVSARDRTSNPPVPEVC
jgi:hypothetical protein